MTYEPSEYPDLEEYWLASFEHAESHYAASSDSEWCEGDCAHWPSWWGGQGMLEADRHSYPLPPQRVHGGSGISAPTGGRGGGYLHESRPTKAD
jgi:hypothetical protein